MLLPERTLLRCWTHRSTRFRLPCSPWNYDMHGKATSGVQASLETHRQQRNPTAIAAIVETTRSVVLESWQNSQEHSPTQALPAETYSVQELHVPVLVPRPAAAGLVRPARSSNCTLPSNRRLGQAVLSGAHGRSLPPRPNCLVVPADDHAYTSIHWLADRCDP